MKPEAMKSEKTLPLTPSLRSINQYYKLWHLKSKSAPPPFQIQQAVYETIQKGWMVIAILDCINLLKM